MFRVEEYDTKFLDKDEQQPKQTENFQTFASAVSVAHQLTRERNFKATRTVVIAENAISLYDDADEAGEIVIRELFQEPGLKEKIDEQWHSSSEEALPK